MQGADYFLKTLKDLDQLTPFAFTTYNPGFSVDPSANALELPECLVVSTALPVMSKNTTSNGSPKSGTSSLKLEEKRFGACV